MYVGKRPARLSESTLASLPLMAYLALAIGLMITDHRMQLGAIIRQRCSLVTEPLWWLASTPAQLFHATREHFISRGQLQRDNARLRHALEIALARIHRLNAISEENRRLRQLLGGTRGYGLNVQMVGILDIDLDPYQQRLVLDAGSDKGVIVGQVLIDASGVLGQVIEVSEQRAIALLLTDPDHAVPVQVARSGLRAIAYGTGRSNQLSLPNIPQSADIRSGDLLMTSGIGGRFPAGFPVGRVTVVHADNTRLFLLAEAQPTAHLERGTEVLLVSNRPPILDMGPPAPLRSSETAVAPTGAGQ